MEEENIMPMHRITKKDSSAVNHEGKKIKHFNTWGKFYFWSVFYQIWLMIEYTRF